VFIPVLKSPNGHLGSSDVDLGRKTECCLFTLGSFIDSCTYAMNDILESNVEIESSRYEVHGTVLIRAAT